MQQKHNKAVGFIFHCSLLIVDCDNGVLEECINQCISCMGWQGSGDGDEVLYASDEDATS